MKLTILAITVALLAVGAFAQDKNDENRDRRPRPNSGDTRPPAPGGRPDKPNSDDNDTKGRNGGSDDNAGRDDSRNGGEHEKAEPERVGGNKPNPDDNGRKAGAGDDNSNTGGDDTRNGNDRDKERNGGDGDKEQHGGNGSNDRNGDKEESEKPTTSDRTRLSLSVPSDRPDSQRPQEPIVTSALTLGKPETFNDVIIQGQIAVITPATASVSGYSSGNTNTNNNNDNQQQRPQQITSVVSQEQSRNDFLARGSRVTVYVSTKNNNDRNNAFAHFDLDNIDWERSHTFPLNFNLTVELPSELRGRSDFTLYLFAFIRNDRRGGNDVFVPGGISRVLLVGTNRLVQQLTLLVRPAGVLVQGVVVARYMPVEISPDTAFRVVIVEESLQGRPIVEVQINKPGSRYPVPFSLLVPYQLMKPNMNYYAFAFILVNGNSRPISHKPVWVITQAQELVQQQITFVVTPVQFNIRVHVVPSESGSRGGELQEGSNLVVNLIQVDARQKKPITYFVGKITRLPATLDVNLSSDKDFDGSKQYYVQAIVLSSKNRPYMQTMEPILLPEQSFQIDLRVEDLVYFVQAYVQPSQLTALTFLPNSTAQIFVTDDPETPKNPIFATRITVSHTLTEFNIELDVSRIQKDRNYYIVVFVAANTVITHVARVLVISQGLPPSNVIQVPLISLNIISGTILDVNNRPAAWVTPSKAVCYLMDSTAIKLGGDKNALSTIVQTWDINLNNDFPIRFNVQLDFSRLVYGRTYDMQCLIKDQSGTIEYNWAGSALVFSPEKFVNNIELLVNNVKTNYTVHGLVYIENQQEVDAAIDAHIRIRVTTTPEIHNPRVVKEIDIKVNGKRTPIPFEVTVPLSEVNLHTYYYILAEYIVGDHVIFPAIQAFAFSFRPDVDVVVSISQSPLVGINGQVQSPTGNLVLPEGCKMHIYITEQQSKQQSTGIISEVYLVSKPNQNYLFTLNLQLVLIEQQRPLFLNAAVLCNDKVIMQMPQPSALQLAAGGDWNINMVVSVPTLLIGTITTSTAVEFPRGNWDVYFSITVRGQPLTVLQTFHIQVTQLPAVFSLEGNTTLLFDDRRPLEISAVIKSCKDDVLFQSGGAVVIQQGININLVVPLILVDTNISGKPSDLILPVDPNSAGSWVMSITALKQFYRK